jgi:hypothetical protein
MNSLEQKGIQQSQAAGGRVQMRLHKVRPDPSNTETQRVEQAVPRACTQITRKHVSSVATPQAFRAARPAVQSCYDNLLS